MIYYLKIADIGIKINCPDNLYLFDDWQMFIEQRWGKPFLVKKIRPDIIVDLVGMRVKGLKVVPNNLKNINFPMLKGNRLIFDNLLGQDYLLILLAKIIKEKLINKGGIIMHASGVIVNNKAVLIMGESGSGKTTALRKLMKVYQPIAEDDVAIIMKGGRIMTKSVLFSNKIDSNLLAVESYEVGVILTIKKDSDLYMEKMSCYQALGFLLDQSKSAVNDFKKAKRIMKYAKLLSNRVYTVYCKRDDNLDGIIKKIKL